MLAAGERIPDADVWLAPQERVSLRGLAEEGPVLFLFYLFDWSSTWTNEMELLRDRSADFDQAGVRIFGVSRDSPWTHIAWTQALDLNFPLVSDWNAEAIEGLGIAREFRGYRDVAVRSAFLADRDGTIQRVWSYDDGEVPDVDELLVAARSL